MSLYSFQNSAKWKTFWVYFIDEEMEIEKWKTTKTEMKQMSCRKSRFSSLGQLYTPVNKLQYCPCAGVLSLFLGCIVTQTSGLLCFFQYYKETARTFRSPGSWSCLLLHAPAYPACTEQYCVYGPCDFSQPVFRLPCVKSSSSNHYGSLYLHSTAVPQDTMLHLDILPA